MHVAERSTLALRRFTPVLAVLILACSAPQETEPMMSEAEIEAAIDEVRAAWIAGADADDAAAVAALYAEDAVYIPPTGEAYSGRAAIEAYLAQSFAMSSDAEVTVMKSVVSGDVVAQTGEYTLTMTPPGAEAMDVSGHYTVVLRHEDDGSWKLVSHLTAQPAEMPGG